MSRVNITVGNGGFIQNYVADVAVTMVVGLGYYLFKALKKKEDKSSWTDTKDGLKTLKSKLEGALASWQYASTVEEYHELIKSNYEGIEDPFAILNLMNKSGVLPTIETYNALLLNCLLTNNNESAELLKDEMLDSMGPVTPNVYTLNVLIKGLNLKFKNLIFELNSGTSSFTTEKQNLFSEFDKDLTGIIESMENRNVYMDLFSQNTILEALVDLGRLNEAWSQYSNMKVCYTPDIYTYTTLINGIKATSELSEEWLDKAFQILEETKNNYEVDEAFFNSLLDACVRFNRLDRAEELFNEMTEKRGVISEYAYNIMIKGYGKMFKLTKAYEMFNRIKLLNNEKKQDDDEKSEKEEYIPNSTSYASMLNASTRCKDIDLAEHLVCEMTKNKVEKNLNIYSTMVNGYRKTKNYSKAFELYDYLNNKIEYENEKEEKPGLKLSTIFFNSILECCVEAQNYKKMDEIATYMKEKASTYKNSTLMDLITYSIVIKGYAKSNSMSKLTEIYSLMQTNKEGKLDDMLYKSIMDCYSRNDDEANVIRVFNDMKVNKVILDVVIYGIIIKLYCNMKNCNKAFELFDECVKAEIKPTVIIYQMLIKLQVKSQCIDRAITLFRNMLVNGVQPDMRIYELIVQACLDQDRIKEAAEFIIGATRGGIKFEKYIYDTIAKSILSTGNFKIAEKCEYVRTLLKCLGDFNIIIDRNTHEIFCSVLNENEGNNYYSNRQTGYSGQVNHSGSNFNNNPQMNNHGGNYNNNYTKRNNYRNYNGEQEEKSIYDTNVSGSVTSGMNNSIKKTSYTSLSDSQSNSNSIYNTNSYTDSTSRNSFKSKNKNSNFSNQNFFNFNNYSEEKSIYS